MPAAKGSARTPLGPKNFVFTGLNIRQNENNEIFVGQNDFVRNVEIPEFTKQDLENVLNKAENRLVRKIQGQLHKHDQI